MLYGQILLIRSAEKIDALKEQDFVTICSEKAVATKSIQSEKNREIALVPESVPELNTFLACRLKKLATLS